MAHWVLLPSACREPSALPRSVRSWLSASFVSRPDSQANSRARAEKVLWTAPPTRAGMTTVSTSGEWHDRQPRYRGAGGTEDHESPGTEAEMAPVFRKRAPPLQPPLSRKPVGLQN